MSVDFTLDQKRYLEGFAAGFSARGGQKTPPAQAQPMGPDAAHFSAQDRVTAAGGKLTDQEK
ncbi:MAG: NirA family protein, partial [Methylocystis sp.]